MKSYQELIILIAEDDDGHAELIRDGFYESGIINEIIRFRNGEEVWHFLTGMGHQVRDASKLYVLLLDINMPLMDGIDVLRHIKSDATLTDIPVIILTTTDDPSGIEECYKLGCNVYITKPINFSHLSDILNKMGLFIQIMKVIN